MKAVVYFNGGDSRLAFRQGTISQENFMNHLDWVNSVCFSPDGKYIVSGSVDNTVRLWDAQSGQEVEWQDASK